MNPEQISKREVWVVTCHTNANTNVNIFYRYLNALDRFTEYVKESDHLTDDQIKDAINSHYFYDRNDSTTIELYPKVIK